MSNYEFRLPDIGEGIAEAEIVAWHVKPGDMVDEDAPLADMMTDKATIEMTSPVAGKVVGIAGEVGEQIPIGSVLVTFAIEGEPDKAAPTPDTTPSEPQAHEGSQTPSHPSLPAAQAHAADPGRTAGSKSAKVEPERPGPRDAEPNPDAVGERHDRKIFASPAVRTRARALGINLAEVRTETDRIRHADLDSFLLYNRGGGYRPAGARRADEQVKVIGLRRRIAENMAASKRHIPHFTYVEELDVTKLEALRNDLNAGRGEKPRLTILPLLVTAFCRAIPQFPMLNARFNDETGVVTRSGAVHVGIATQTDAGLIVPVVRHAEELNIWQLSREIARLADAARSGKAQPEELSGSTITVTSLGPLGGLATTPVINRPEVAILGPNKIVERPVFAPDGRVVAAKLMNLSISCDHRVVDGWDAASFVQAVKQMIETPALLFAP